MTRTSPSVFLHIGEPKTGTTFIQQVMWANRPTLLEHGVLVPGPRPMAHWRAAQDLREVPQIENDPVGPNAGAWDRLVQQALRAPRVAVISHELFAAADERQAERALRSLADAEAHVVLTVRDFGTLLPAEWQETVKHRNTREWGEWLSDVIDRESVAPDRRQYWFWRVHDTLEILRIWGAHLPPERIHVITAPRRGADSSLLWRRFAGVIGVDPSVIDVAGARSNAGLALPDVELLRRVNAALPASVPGWFYMRNVKDALAHGALADRPSSSGRLQLPASRFEWVSDHAQHVVAALRATDYDIVGDLDDLTPQPSVDARDPSDVPVDEILDSGVAAVVALLEELGKTQGLAPDRGPAGDGPRAASPRRGPVKQFVIELSARHPSVHRLRRAYWHVVNAARRTRASRAEPRP